MKHKDPSIICRALPIALIALLGASGCADSEAGVQGDDDHQSRASVACGDAATDAVKTPEVIIGEVTAFGPGCRPGSFAIEYEDHATGLSGHKNVKVHLQEHRVALDASAPFSESSCIFSVPVRVPAGWQYALTQIDVRANVSLEAGEVGQFDLDYGFRGYPSVQLSNKKFIAGPLQEDDYTILDAVNSKNIESTSAWSSCTDFRSLTFSTSLFVRVPMKEPAMERDGESRPKNGIQLTEVGPLKLALRRCPDPAIR
jgi:hypothetical protein